MLVFPGANVSTFSVNLPLWIWAITPKVWAIQIEMEPEKKQWKFWEVVTTFLTSNNVGSMLVVKGVTVYPLMLFSKMIRSGPFLC